MSTLRAILVGLIGALVLPGHSLAAENPEFVDTNGTRQHPLKTNDSTATVLIFVWNTCPVANAYAPEIERIYQQYKKDDIAFYLVHTDPDLTLSKAQQHTREYGYTLPVLIDREHLLVKHVGAKMTPEAAVVLPNGTLVYRGRIDNRQAALGKRRPKATVFDLRDTLDQIVSGATPRPRFTKAVGCYIPETN